MDHFSFESTMPVSAERLFEWHCSPVAFERLLPPWRRVELLTPHPPLEQGGEVAVRLHFGMRAVETLHRITQVEKGSLFVDEQIVGPMVSWHHKHRMRDLPDGTSVLEEKIDYQLPAWGRLFGGKIDGELKRLFGYRHRVTAGDLATLARHPSGPLRIAITGSSGLIGRPLCLLLRSGGHTVIPLVRKAAQPGEVEWSPDVGVVNPAALEGVDAVIHLAGENVAGRWTAAKKERIESSRVQGTRHLVRSLSRLNQPPAALLVSSGVGYYGDPGADPVTEASPLGSGFLAGVSKQWEEEAMRYDKGRVVTMRTGVVLSLEGGALARMLPAFRAGLGGPIASGKQGVSWISIDDMIYQIYHLLMTQTAEGAYNLVAPHPVTHRQLSAALGRALHRPALLPMPLLAVRTLFGEMGEELLVKGVFAVPQRLIEAGAPFRYPTVESALSHLFS